MFLGNPIYLHLPSSSHIQLFISLPLCLSLFNSLVSLFSHSLPHSPSQQSWKLNPVIFPPTVPFSAHLGVNLHIIQINISEVSGEYSKPLQRRPPTPNPSVLLVLAGVLFCLPEPALMACFSQHLSHVQEQHLAKFKCTRVQVSQWL